MSFSRTAFAIAVIVTSVLMHLGLLGVIVLAERRGLSKPETETIEVELVKPEVLQEELKKQEQKKKDPLKFEYPDVYKQRQKHQQQQQQQQQQQASSQSAP